jgi:hypothetical protein
MVEDVLTRPGALAGDDVDDAVRQDAFQEVHQFQDAEGRRARWLEDDRTAGGQGRCQFPGGHEEGEVPRDDLADDANRFVDDQAQRVVVQGRRPAVFAADDAGEVAEMVGCCRDVDGLRFPDGLAVVQGFDEGQRVGILIDDVGDFQEDGLSFSGRYVLPGREGSLGGADSGVDVVLRRFGTDRQDFTVGRVDGFKGRTVAGRDPAAIDI